ncbi:peptidase C26 [Synergistales bacterium]|nr:peptidase C26 [Synergistales bacterium]
MRPLIGLTSYYVNPKAQAKAPLSAVFEESVCVSYPQYAARVEKAGAIPLDIPYFKDDNSIAVLAEKLDGVLFIGGEDIDPMYYSEPMNGSKDMVPERDELEIKLIESFYKARKPIFGICRGLQLINVFFRGSLIQDIPKEAETSGKPYLRHTRNDAKNESVHNVNTVKGTRLAELLGDSFGVNSLHHQATRRPGDGLLVSAYSEDGLIEGLEHPDYPFLIGVQWHPERLSEAPHFKLFEAFVKACDGQK